LTRLRRLRFVQFVKVGYAGSNFPEHGERIVL
jgi:hypothetical protein